MIVTPSHQDIELEAAAALLASRFRGRTDVYLIEQNGQIRTVRAPLTDKVMISHLKGECRIGCFPIKDERTAWLSWDIDCEDLSILRAILHQCVRWGLPVLVERSKSKGYHIWVLFIDPVSASVARDVGIRLMTDAGVNCEVFPKQTEVKADGVGNGVFLPWHGISLRQNRTVFIDPQNFDPFPDQLEHLRFHERLPKEWIECVRDLCRESVTSPQGTVLLEQAVKEASNGTRNDIGFQLARKLRDGGLSEAEAKPLMLSYAKAVSNLGVPPYVEPEALASLSSAYSKSAPTAGSTSERQSFTDKLVALAMASADFFHTSEQAAYAVIHQGTHDEVWPLKSKHFKQWVSRKYFEQYRKVLNATAIGDAILALEGQALFCGPENLVHLRVAEHEGKVIIDLCNPDWECIVVDATGWHVLQHAPVKFRRSRGMLALPSPAHGGSIEDLREFINLDSKEEWFLLVVWMLYALRARGPYVVLVLQGEHGSAKTTTVRFIRSNIDPNIAPVRSEPKEGRDLLISATNSHIQAFDNLSSIAPWFSDALCRLSTGGGLATRELFSDCEEMIFNAVRPVMINGIESMLTRPDLLDRAGFLTLPTIGERTRRSEMELLENFERARPRIFGAMLSALSKTLRELPNVKLDRLPRMADFAIFGVAVERALGWPSGCFLKAYESNRTEAHSIALEASAVAGPIEELMSTSGKWEGTATKLLETVNGIAAIEMTRKRGWPTTPRQLANQLTRLAPNLRSVGITMRKDRKGRAGTRMIHLKKEETTITELKPQQLSLMESMDESCVGGKETQNTKANKEDRVIHPRLKELSKSFKRVKPQQERR